MGKIFCALLFMSAASVISGQNVMNNCAHLASSVFPEAGTLGSRDHCSAVVGNIKSYTSHLNHVTSMLLASNYEYMQVISPTRRFDQSELVSLGFALDREKHFLGSISQILKTSGGSETLGDPLLNDFLESSFTSENMKRVRDISGLLNNFHAMSGPYELPLATFHINQALKKLTVD
ncbi:unnamed protein product [Notodromas monacha]|uniref:Uncharacterized protein n=1 Tax=Notodromas monacha TaxID=399045 RepID=A0A7R9BDM9_9CRUS|nr:unnamed protein product [Notodromas monacha]CAG0913393.1 unnamed protein product [Notodromas monacha]